ncbi:MAG TPA: TonB-dependent receptor [Candidatus Acidoferrum sp.]|nr:TonB-dependent receptor [Candidatus Acidoferrum sp.]
MKWASLISLVVLFSVPGDLAAQTDRATVTGTISDPSGAVVPGVQVVATNSASGLQLQTSTNALGAYALLNLPIGRYTLATTKQGFADYRQTGIVLLIGQAVELNIHLSVATGTSSAVVVASEVPPLETQTYSISTNLSNAAVSELPLNVQGGRNLSDFMFAYVPSVEGTDFASHIGGGLSHNKEVMIDGTSAVSQIGGYLSESAPPFEAVQELQVTSAGIRADDGRTGGGVFRYEMKSGTNSWHGSGFFYMHNEALDARSWGDKYNEGVCLSSADGDPSQTASCQRAFGKPDDRLYTYGASFGGPIHRDKLFFYAAWERYTFANTGIGALSSTVPTPAFLAGDFSALLGPNLCTNPANGTQAACGGDFTNPISVQNDAGQTVPLQAGMIFNPSTGNQFTGNMIPFGSISSVSQKIIDLYKKFYQPLAPTLTNNNALPLASPATWYQTNQYSLKLDSNLSSTQRLDGSFIYAYIPRLLSDQGGIWSAGSIDGGPMANAYDHNTTAPSVRVRHTWTISSSLVNVLSATFNRFRNPSVARTHSQDWPQTLGLGDFGAGNFPVIRFQGINNDQQRFVNGLPINESPLGSQFNDAYAANTFIYDDTLSWIRGRHSFRFGADFRVQQFNSHGDSGVPTFAFDPAQTAGPYGPNTGFGFASFLLGDVNQASVSEPDSIYGRRKSVSLFAQDNFKVTRKLTLNFDLRWDFNGRYHEKYGHWSTFDTTARNPVTGLPGALVFATGGGDSFERKQSYHNFSGALGGAYQITPKTVVRASFGFFYVPLNLNTYSGVPYGFNPGYVLNNQVLMPFAWDDGYPGQAVDIGKNPNFVRYGMVSVDPRMLELGNIQQWTVGVQQELGRQFVFAANFVQNHGYHLESGYVNGNQPILSDYTALAQSGNLFGFVTQPGFSGPAFASVAPFPNVAATFGPLFFVGSPRGNNDYQSLQLSIQKRPLHGLSLLASYNLSSCHGDVDNSFEDLFFAGPLQNLYDLEGERHTICSFDQKHIVKGYALYELPFGRGQQLLGNAGSALNAFVGGWTLSGDVFYATGMPLRIPANVFYPGIFNVYSDIVPGCDYSKHYNGQVGATYFNPACFVNPPFGDFGDAPGYLAGLRKPNLATEDLGLSKTMHFACDGCQLRIYFQVFNVFNRHGFAGPNTQIGSAGFGQVLPQDLNGLPGPRVGQLGARFTF